MCKISIHSAIVIGASGLTTRQVAQPLVLNYTFGVYCLATFEPCGTMPGRGSVAKCLTLYAGSHAGQST